MKIGVTGIAGRMGGTICNLILENNIIELGAGLEKADKNLDGKDLGEFLGKEKIGVKITSDLDKFVSNCDAIIDFSAPQLTLECAKRAAKMKKILVSGTTGFSEEEKQQLISYGEGAVIIWSSNMSIGVNLLINLAQKVAGILHDDYDAEIFEMHHRHKVDAPSGTALSLGEAVAKGRGLNFGEVSRKTRDGIVGKRQKNEIGFCALRGGDVIGDHSVIFAGEGERIELTHKASNRIIYAQGAIRAAIWGSNQKAGFYSMRDVLSF